LRREVGWRRGAATLRVKRPTGRVAGSATRAGARSGRRGGDTRPEGRVGRRRLDQSGNVEIAVGAASPRATATTRAGRAASARASTSTEPRGLAPSRPRRYLLHLREHHAALRSHRGPAAARRHLDHLGVDDGDRLHRSHLELLGGISREPSGVETENRKPGRSARPAPPARSGNSRRRRWARGRPRASATPRTRRRCRGRAIRSRGRRGRRRRERRVPTQGVALTASSARRPSSERTHGPFAAAMPSPASAAARARRGTEDLRVRMC
jgi:pyruvate/2-oxoglutarate dehydrogenase complex dihydrolipoamide acyltransferase (E2) component